MEEPAKPADRFHLLRAWLEKSEERKCNAGDYEEAATDGEQQIALPHSHQQHAGTEHREDVAEVESVASVDLQGLFLASPHDV